MEAPARSIAGFFRELRRRQVFRTAGLYIVGAWLVLQAAGLFFPGWGLPDAALNALLVACVLGFPLALVFGWYYDISPEGIRRTPAADRDGAGQRRPLQRVDFLILGSLSLIAVFIVYDAATGIIDTPRVAGTEAPVVDDVPIEARPPNSVAVLPFVNMSGDPANEYFADGVSEEILQRLGGYPELHVIGRTSSFAFKGSDYRIPRISALLGVRHLLQGSVRRQGDQLRISAQLVDGQGTQIWSASFDRTLENVFAIQAEIADVVATTIVPRISPGPAENYRPELAAYERFLVGRELVYRRLVEDAVAELERALQLDPGFAEAYAELAIARLIGVPDAAEFEAAEAAIRRALHLRPGLPRALAARGLSLTMRSPPDLAAAEDVLRRALAGDPGMVDAMNWLAGALTAQGKDEESFEITKRAAGLDPLHASIANGLASQYAARGEPRRAERVLLRLTELPEPNRYAFIGLRNLYLETGQLVKMNALEKRFALTGLNVYFGLALNYAVLGLRAESAYWVERMAREFPDSFFAPYYATLMPEWRGDYAGAAAAYAEAMESRGLTLADPPQLVVIWYGRDLALAGDHGRAAEILEPALADQPPAKLAGEYEGDAAHALAWSWQALGDPTRARVLLETIDGVYLESDERGRHESNPALYMSALTALLLGDSERALDRLERAIDAGWRDYYIRHHDPRWAALAGNPRYEALMIAVKADVDRQRAEVERIDREEDFPALLDRVRAARE